MIAVAVLAAFSVRPRWRLSGLLFAAAVWCIGTGLRGEFLWPGSFEIRWLCLVAAGLLAVASKRFAFLLPTVLVLWFLGAWGNSALGSASDAIGGLHHLSAIALAGVGVAAFARLIALAWHSEPIRPSAAECQDAGWKAVSIAAGLLLVALVLPLAFVLTYQPEPLGLQAPLGLLVALAESVAGMCLWRATVQMSQIEERQSSLQHDIVPVGWTTMVGLMVVFVLTGLAFAIVPVILTF